MHVKLRRSHWTVHMLIVFVVNLAKKCNQTLFHSFQILVFSLILILFICCYALSVIHYMPLYVLSVITINDINQCLHHTTNLSKKAHFSKNRIILIGILFVKFDIFRLTVRPKRKMTRATKPELVNKSKKKMTSLSVTIKRNHSLTIFHVKQQPTGRTKIAPTGVKNVNWIAKHSVYRRLVVAGKSLFSNINYAFLRANDDLFVRSTFDTFGTFLCLFRILRFNRGRTGNNGNYFYNRNSGPNYRNNGYNGNNGYRGGNFRNSRNFNQRHQSQSNNPQQQQDNATNSLPQEKQINNLNVQQSQPTPAPAVAVGGMYSKFNWN